ncbi:MAG: zinc ribbon domain-containing protein [Candidatus Omnitrophica bacterium]|nr:zinc ribbon domain-containing protein [Candidatus Omnitrophota bacterium]
MNNEYSEFQEVTEQSEQLDFNRTKPCPHCQNPIPADAVSCYYCGRSLSPGKKWVVWAFAAIAGIFLVRFIIGLTGLLRR